MKQVRGPRRVGDSGPLNELQAGFFRTLGHPARVRILEALTDGERSVGELLPCVGVEASTLSQHLGVLRRAGLIVGRRDSHTIIYALAYPELADIVGLTATVLAGTFAHRPGLLHNRLRDAGAAARTTPRPVRPATQVVAGQDR